MSFITLHIVNRITVIAVFMLLTSLTGCTKGDDINAFTFDGTTRGLRSAFLFYASSPDKIPDADTVCYQNILMLLSAGLTTDGHPITGPGNAIALLFFSTSQDLNAGTYTFSGTDIRVKPFNIPAGHVQLDDMDTSSPQGAQLFPFNTGQMNVTRTGTDYTINIAGTIEGKILKAHFTGTMTTLPKN